jgi:hypothetical protein
VILVGLLSAVIIYMVTVYLLMLLFAVSGTVNNYNVTV